MILNGYIGNYMLPACNEEKGLMLDEDGDLEVWKYEDI
jgi:hypothetical protein